MTGCTSFPERLPRERFTLKEANRRGFKTELKKAAVIPDGKVLVMSTITLRKDRNTHPESLALVRLNRDGTPDPAFKTDSFFSENNIEVPMEPFLFADHDGSILFPLYVWKKSKEVGHTGTYRAVFRLSSSGTMISTHTLNIGDWYTHSGFTLVPRHRNGRLEGFYYIGETKKSRADEGNVRSILLLDRECRLAPSFRPVMGMRRVDERIKAHAQTVTPKGGLVYLVEYGYNLRKTRGVQFDIRKIDSRGNADTRYTKNIRPHLLNVTAVHDFMVDPEGKLYLSMRTGNIYRDGMNCIRIFDPKGRRIGAFDFNEVSEGTTATCGVDVRFTSVTPDREGGLYVLRRHFGKGTLIRLDSRGKIVPGFSKDFTDKRTEYNNSMAMMPDGTLLLQEKHLWRFNPDGSIKDVYKLCSDWDFKFNKSLIEWAADGCYLGCMGSLLLIYTMFGGRATFMP